MRTVPARARLAILLGLAATLRLLWLLAVPNAQVADARWYYARAVAMTAGEGYTIDGVTTAFWPVGYPAFLGGLFALFGTSPWVGESANVVLGLLAIMLAYLLALKLFNRPAVARYTLLLLAFYPASIAHTSLLLSELLFVPLMLLGVLLLLPQQLPPALRLLRLTAAGATLGLATLTRPQAVLIPVAVYVALVFQRHVAAPRGARLAGLAGSCLVVYLALALTLIPWTARNLQVFGALVFVSTNGGFNLYVGNGSFATGTNLAQPVIDAQIAPLAATASGEADADRLLR
ncbi:MAG: glycosyltransferase family 39 protein, partial [Chloroflexales bacterium]|nr:glycosyltransferase family 39 protein [Chloroflexales bacterium]